MKLAGLAWLFTAAVLLHNTEEALFLPGWSRRVRRWYRPVGDAEFRLAASVVSVAFVLLTFAATTLPGAEVQYVFAGYVVALLANALVPHLAVTLGLREYMPGTATAWLLVVPLGLLYLGTAVGQHIVEVPTLLWVGPLVALCLLAAIPVLFLLARLISGRTPGGNPEAQPRHSHPTGRASVAGAVLGIVLIASAVVAIVPVALSWPASWPGAVAAVAAAGVGVALISRHMARHHPAASPDPTEPECP